MWWEAFLSTAVGVFAPRSAICVLAHGSQGAEPPVLGSPSSETPCSGFPCALQAAWPALNLNPWFCLWLHPCKGILSRLLSLPARASFPCGSWHTLPWLAALPASNPSSQALPVLWLTLNATYQRRNLLLFFHLASSGFIASIWAKGYFPLYGGEVIICSCVSSHCSRAMPFPNFTMGMLFVHLAWLWGLCSLWNLPAGTWESDHPSHRWRQCCDLQLFFTPLKEKKKFPCWNWDLSELSALHQGWISQLF